MRKVVPLAGGLLLLSASALVGCTPSPAPVSCGGAKATIVVSASSPQTVNGTAGNDVIAVTGGIHTVRGGAGNDTMCADALGTTLDGGDGNDRLIGGASGDRLLGGNGNDTLDGGGGNDDISGMTGHDVKDGGTGSNYCDTDPSDAAAVDCIYDPRTPVIHSLAVTTPQLNFRNGDREMDYKLNATDMGGGIWTINVSLCGPDGKADGTQTKFAMPDPANAAAGDWIGDQELPDDAPSGTWSICTIQLLDLHANWITYATNPTPGSNDRPMPSGNTFTVANDGTDHTAPAISQMTITPSVDVTSHDATVTCDFSVAERGSGLREVNVQLRHLFGTSAMPQAHLVDNIVGESNPANPELITPDPTHDAGSGRYHATIVLPVGSAAGLWFADIYAYDNAGNQTEQTVTMNNVVDSNPITDFPHLVDGSVTQDPTADIANIRLHIKSARDEVVNPNGVDLSVRNPAGQLVDVGVTLASGTSTDGIWLGQVYELAAMPGTWTVDSVSIDDRLSMFGQVPARELATITGSTWSVG